MSSGQSVGGDSGDAMSRAVDAYDQGELDASRVLCEQQLRVEPSNAVALMLLGLIAKRGLQVEDAIPLLERSVRIAPNRKSLTSLADCYLRVGRLKQGLHYIDQVLAGNTDNLEALLIKAAILHGQQKFDDALACIDDAARLAPESHLVEARLGSVLAELGQYEAAEQHFQAAARVSREARHCGLINFRQSVWRQIAPSAAVAVADEFAHLRAPDIEAPYDAVVAACCDARYFYKYGVTFMNSYAQNAAGGKLLHLHILDPEEGFAAHLETLIAQLGLRNVVATYEYAPVDEEPDFNLRRTFYSCARFLRMAALLAHYQKTIACFDIDTVFEAPLDELVGSVGGADIGLVRRDRFAVAGYRRQHRDREQYRGHAALFFSGREFYPPFRRARKTVLASRPDRAVLRAEDDGAFRRAAAGRANTAVRAWRGVAYRQSVRIPACGIPRGALPVGGFCAACQAALSWLRARGSSYIPSGQAARAAARSCPPRNFARFGLS